ncbi:acyltransferase family protein [Hydrogenophaga sp.]|uniref:acyltransferase family protein n=1 Tax=Hydrogenophaga sp. TaxID=1904254 RepID=UPI003F6F078C
MNYRREIDGLRAVAVLPVLLFHAGAPGFSGGYVGVDVFFVISGYLITGIVLDELSRGSFSFTGFYERRVRRILPALFVVILATLILSWWVLLPEDFKAFSKSMLAVVLFVSNFLFWSESGYFDASAELLPLLHTWSLAVEEQYYLIYPALVVLIFRRGIRQLSAMLAGVAVTSFALAAWGSRTYPDAAFYLLPFRSWELAAGALVALHLRSGRQLASRTAGSWWCLVGLFLLLASVSAFDRAMPWPGASALLPVAGAVLLILFAGPHNVVGRLLGSRVLVGVGLVTYSAYLWHQPLFALARLAALEEPSLAAMLMLCTLSVLLAALTWRFVEQPFRQKGFLNRRGVFMGALALSLGLASLAFLIHTQQGFPERVDRHARVADMFRWQGIATPCGERLPLPADIEAQCHWRAGVQPGDVHTLLVGDSHADAFLPALVAASRDLGIEHAYIGMGGCIPLLGVDVRSGVWPEGVCRALVQAQYEHARRLRPRNVLLVARWGMYIDGNNANRSARRYFLVENDGDPHSREHSRAVFVRALERTARAYAALGARVHLMEQVPQQTTEPRKVFFQLNRAGLWGEAAADTVIRRHALPYPQHQMQAARVRRLLDRLLSIEGFRVLNPEQVFCSVDRCWMGDRDGPWYQDRDHLNIRGAEKAALWVQRQLLDP